MTAATTEAMFRRRIRRTHDIEGDLALVPKADAQTLRERARMAQVIRVRQQELPESVLVPLCTLLAMALLAMENDATKQEASKDEVLLSDHMYDGIREYENPMPGWWVWIFWGSFYFAICYVLWFHVFMRGTSVAQEYQADMAAFREEEAKRAIGAAPSEEGLEKLMANAAVMSDAEVVFKKRCVPCHAEGGKGLIGPNLTDDYWIHGKGTLMDIYGVVNGGVPSRGMPEWGKQLPMIEVVKVAAYVGTLRGRHTPGKAPEGTLLPSAAPSTPGK